MDLKNHPKIELSKSKTSFAANDAMIETSRYTLSDLHPITRLSQKMSQTLNLSDTISIQPITEADSQEVLTFLKANFFKDEPLNTFLELGECKELEEFSLKCIPEHCSFKAVNSQKKIVGVLLNSLIKKSQTNEEQPKLGEKCEHPKFKKILGLMDYIDSNFNIFDVFPEEDVVIDAKIVSVSPECRGQGVAGRLTERSIEYMRLNKISVMQMLCSSHYSARVVEKMDFKEVYRLNYADYKVNGDVVLKPEQPHVAARILVKKY